MKNFWSNPLTLKDVFKKVDGREFMVDGDKKEFIIKEDVKNG